jgi:hypothetical protein
MLVLALEMACGRPAQEPPPAVTVPASPDPALDRVDLAAVHREWFVPGVSCAAPSEPLRAAVAPDPTLSAAVREIEYLCATGAVEDEAARVAGRWNDYMRLAGRPWRVEILAPPVVGDRPRMLATTFRAVGEAPFTRGGGDGVAEVWDHADGATLPHGWLGSAAADRPVVVRLDAVRTFALDELWPMLDPGAGDTTDAQRRFAEAVRGQAAAALSPPELAALAATGEDRLWLVRTAESIAARASCGSTFSVARLPWNGLDRASLEALRLAALHPDPACPEVQPMEHLALAVRSGRIRGQTDLEPALQRLVALAARAFLVHELRHAADLAAGGPTCTVCPPDMDRSDLREVAAYLASIADPAAGAIAAYQACALRAAGERTEILDFVSERLGGLCEGGSADPAAVSEALFGPSPAVEIRSFPDRLPLTSP